MIRRVVVVFLMFGGLVIVVGCASDGTPKTGSPAVKGETTPRASLKQFRKMLRNGNWKYVHLLMSERARSLYTRSRIKTFLQRTKPGALERYRLLTWNVVDVTRVPDRQAADVTLQHPSKTKYRQTYRFVLENGIWRLDWSLADLLDVPRAVESKTDDSERERNDRPSRNAPDE